MTSWSRFAQKTNALDDGSGVDAAGELVVERECENVSVKLAGPMDKQGSEPKFFGQTVNLTINSTYANERQRR